MGPTIPSKHHSIRLNLHTELAKQIQKYPNNRVGNHDHLGINKHQARIETVVNPGFNRPTSMTMTGTTWPPPQHCNPCPLG